MNNDHWSIDVSTNGLNQPSQFVLGNKLAWIIRLPKPSCMRGRHSPRDVPSVVRSFWILGVQGSNVHDGCGKGVVFKKLMEFGDRE